MGKIWCQDSLLCIDSIAGICRCLSITLRQEVRTGHLVQSDFWTSQLQEEVDHSITIGELNERLDRLSNLYVYSE